MTGHPHNAATAIDILAISPFLTSNYRPLYISISAATLSVNIKICFFFFGGGGAGEEFDFNNIATLNNIFSDFFIIII